MRIELSLKGTDYHIETETSCFIPYKHGKTEKGADKEVCLGYPSTLSRAVQMIIREEQATNTDAVSLLEYIERYEACISELRTQVDFEF